MMVVSTTAEKWLPVFGYTGLYEVSDMGRVRSLPRKVRSRGGYRTTKGRILLFSYEKDGYPMVKLSRDGVVGTYKVHRLVLEAFVGIRKSGRECCHYDGDKENNSIENLRWGTHADNYGDMVRHGMAYRGEMSCKSKLKESEVQQIRALCRFSDFTQKEIGMMYGVTNSAVQNIYAYNTWAWLPEEFTPDGFGWVDYV